MDGTRERWIRLVRRWRRSGQTAHEFARGAGINAATLSHWAWRLKRAAGERRRMPVEPRNSTATVAGPSFVELVPGRIEDRRFELELLDGRRVRIPADFDAAALGRLLAVIGGPADDSR